MTATEHAPPALRFGPFLRSLVRDVAIPLAIVELLLARHVGAVAAFAIAAIVPIASTAYAAARGRLEAIGFISLVALAIGLGLSFMTGSAAFAVAKESLFTAGFGALFLASLLAPRPLTFVLGRALVNDEAGRARWDALWTRPEARFGLRFAAAVWGIGLLADAAVRIALAFTLRPALAAALSSLVTIVVLLGLVAWTRAYSARREAPALG